MLITNKGRNRVVLIALAVVVLAAAFSTFVFEQRHDEAGFARIESQRAKSRTFRAIASEPLSRITRYQIDGEEHLFYHLWLIDTDKDGTCYAFDYSEQAFLVFDKNGRFMARIGKGKGEGPGEFRNVVGFSIDEQSRVWVADAAQNRISCTSLNNPMPWSRKPGVPINRVGMVDDRIIVKVAQTKSELFAVLDSLGNVIDRFGRVHELQDRAVIAMDGDVKFGRDALYAFFRTLPFFCKFSADGDVQYCRETIENPGFPQVHVQSIGGMVGANVDHNAPWISISVSLDEDAGRLYVYTHDPGERRRLFIDAYDTETGDYQFSFDVPDAARGRGISIRGSRMYAAQDTMLSIFELSGLFDQP